MWIPTKYQFHTLPQITDQSLIQNSNFLHVFFFLFLCHPRILLNLHLLLRPSTICFTFPPFFLPLLFFVKPFLSFDPTFYKSDEVYARYKPRLLFAYLCKTFMFALNLKYSAPFGTLRCPENHHIEKFSKLIIPDCPGSNIAEASSIELLLKGHFKMRQHSARLYTRNSVLPHSLSCLSCKSSNASEEPISRLLAVDSSCISLSAYLQLQKVLQPYFHVLDQ